MTSTAVKAGLTAIVILSTLMIGGSSAGATGGRVAMCFVSKTNPDQEYDVMVPGHKVDDLLAASLSYRGVCASYGESAPLGNGRLQVFSQSRHGMPHTIGVAFTHGTLDGLPYDPPTQGTWCYDRDADGTIDQHTECVGGHENALHFSDAFRSGVDSEFRYMLINWNPAGHPPPHVYSVPHFDVHFYLTPDEERLRIRSGPCTVLVHCDDYETAMLPLEPAYVPQDYSYTEAVEPGMGNHMMDFTGDEFNGGKFDHTFIYGHYDAEMTFYEPMVTLETYQKLIAGTLDSACHQMKLPRAWQVAGWYPTRYCLRYRANREELITTLEEFVYREAS